LRCAEFSSSSSAKPLLHLAGEGFYYIRKKDLEFPPGLLAILAAYFTNIFSRILQIGY